VKALLGIVLACLQISAHAEVRVSDDEKRSVTLPRPAMRVISLAPHATELLYAAGGGQAVVATVEYANYPEAAKALPRVGTYSAFDLERIASLKPDLAVVWGSGNPPGQVAQLRRLGIPIFVSEPRQLSDVPSTLRRLGQLLGTDLTATRAAEQFEQRLSALRQRYGGKRAVSVFYEIWNQPLMTVGGEHIISSVINLCGGRNVFAEIDQPASAIGIESVLRANPEAIVASGMGEERPDWLDDWKRWKTLRAVERGHLFFVPPDLLQRHTPRILDGAELLCAALDKVRQ
jgi:iron complex transport system substrate-binding protein